MKKVRKISIFILMIATTIITVAIIAVSNKSYATTGKINSETVRIRKETTTNSDIVAQLDQGDEVEILEEVEGWYKVEYAKSKNEKITGYVSSSLLDVKEKNTQTNNNNEDKNENINTEINYNKPTEETSQETNIEEPSIDNANQNIEENVEYTIQKEIKARLVPLINSKEIGTINNGKVKVVEIINDWCRIENETENGWIRKNTLKKAIVEEGAVPSNTTETMNSTTAKETTATPEKTDETTNTTTSSDASSAKIIKTGYVSTESLKVRKENNTKSEVIDSLKKNDKVSITKELDGWYQIKIGNQLGYVSSKYISDNKVAETTSRGTTQSRVEQVTPIETTPETTTETAGTKGEEVVAYAKQYVGCEYVAGGTSPTSGFDCSGFTQYVYKHFGVTINRVSRDQSKNGTPVDRNNLKPGDLLLFKGQTGSAIGHVGIYIGGGQFVHAANPKEGVKITALSSSYYNTRYVGARRII